MTPCESQKGYLNKIPFFVVYQIVRKIKHIKNMRIQYHKTMECLLIFTIFYPKMIQV